MAKWLLLTPVGQFTAIATAIVGATVAFVAYNKAQEKALEETLERTEDAVNECKELDNEIKSLEDSISDLNKQINDLDPITDEQDVKNLKEETKELEAQLAILKEKKRIESNAGDDSAQKALTTTQDSQYQIESTRYMTMVAGEAIWVDGVKASKVTYQEELQNAMDYYDKQVSLAKEARDKLAEMSQENLNATANGEDAKYTKKQIEQQEENAKFYETNAENARKHANELADIILTQAEGLNGNTEASKSLLASTEASMTGYNAWVESINASTEALQENAEAQTNNTPTKFSISPEQAEKLDKYQSKIDSISKSLGNLHNLEASDISKIMQEFNGEEFGKIFEKWGVTGEKGVGNLKAALEEIANEIKDDATTAVPQMTKAIEEMFAAIEDPKGSIDKYSSEIEELETILEKARAGENIDNIELLINKYGNLEGSIVKTVDGYTLEEDAIISLLNTRIESYNSALAYDAEYTKQYIENVEKRVKAMFGVDADALRDIATYRENNSESKTRFYANREYGIDSTRFNLALQQGYLLNEWDKQYEEMLSTIKELYEKEGKDSTIDWMTTSLANAQEEVDDLNRSFENAKGIEAQKTALSELNTELGNLRTAYVFAADEYNTRYKNALYGLSEYESKYNVDKDDIQRKIEAGFIFDTDSFPSEVAELINDAIDAWNSKRDADNKVIELGIDIDENSIKSLELDIEKASSLKGLSESKLDMSISDSAKLSIYKDLEEVLIDDYYTKEIQLAELNKDSVEVDNLKLQKEKELFELEKNRLELVREIEESEISQLEHQRTLIQNQIDLNGGKGTAEQYIELLSNEEKILAERNDKYIQETALLTKIGEEIGVNSSEYREQLSTVQGCVEELDECTKNTKEWHKALLELPFSDIEKSIEDLSEKLEAVQKDISDMDTVFSGAQAYIQDEIDEQQKLKDVIQEQIDSLQKSNDERQRAIALQKAQYELERAYSQRSVKVFREGRGLVYEQNQEDIRTAQENLDNLKYEEMVHQLEKQIEYYDEIISDLQEIQDAWGKIASEAQDFLNIEKALLELGENDIFNIDVANGKINDYIDKLRAQEDLEDEIESLEDLQNSIQDIIALYENGTITFEQCLADITQVVENSKLIDSEKLAGTIVQIQKLYGLLQNDLATTNDEIKQGIADASKSEKESYEDVTNKLREELTTQKQELETFKSEMIELFGTMCNSMVSQLGTAFGSLEVQVNNLANALSAKVSTIVGQAQRNVSVLKESVREANQLERASANSNMGAGAFVSTVTMQKYHDGIKNGLVGTDNTADALQTVSLRKLEPYEIPALLKVNEAVLTEMQQKTLMDNFGTVYNAGVNSSLNNIIPKNNNTTPVVQNVNLTLPNVTNDGGYNRVVQELKSLQLEALQHSNRK